MRALDELKAQKGTVAANRTLAYARAAYGWAVKRQQILTNPLKGIEQPGRGELSRACSSADELGAIWRAAGELGATLGAFARVLMLTLQRRQEVAVDALGGVGRRRQSDSLDDPRERAKTAGLTSCTYQDRFARSFQPCRG